MVRGENTHVDLGNVTPLLLPWTAAPFGHLRPPLSVEALRLSAEAASATYAMAVDRWMEAGWRDVTIQVNGELTGALEPGSVATQWKLHRVRSRLRQRGPIGQVVGALRQMDRKDTGKVLVMIHPAPEGRYVVAISFMGTGSQFYDWFSNFRMASEGGMHRGFLQLARQFERNEEAILFPETARQLGVERLSLRQILQEARHPGSRFTVWLSGHSQGGALMQVYAHHKLTEDSVLAANLLGYGFASPSVATGTAVDDPAAYPLYHVFNSDDVVPRMGAMVHLGMCLTYPAGEAIAARCYDWPQNAVSQRARELVSPLVERMTDTPACMESMMAFLSILAERTSEELLEVLSLLDVHIPMKRLMTAADSRLDSLMRFTARHIGAAYRSVTGREMDHARVAAMTDEMFLLVARLGLKTFAAALRELMAYPHSIHGRRGQSVGAYIYIVLEGVEALVPSVWVSGPIPTRMEAGRKLLTGSPGDALINRRRETAPRRLPHPPKRPRAPRRRDTRHRTPTLLPEGARPETRLQREVRQG